MTKTIKMTAQDIVEQHSLSRVSAVESIIRQLRQNGPADDLCHESRWEASATANRDGLDIHVSAHSVNAEDDDQPIREMRMSADIEVLGRRIHVRLPMGRASSVNDAILAHTDAIRESLATAIGQIPADAKDITKHTFYRIAA